MKNLTPNSRLVPGSRREQIRVRADVRDDRPMVRIDLLEPLTKHSTAMAVVGRSILIPTEGVAAFIEALTATREEASQHRPAPPAEEGEF